MADERQKILLGKKTDSNLNIYEQRFQMLMKLIRISRMIKNAKPLESEKEKIRLKIQNTNNL